VPERVRGTAAAQEPRADAHQYREASSPGTAVYGHPGADGLSKEIGVVAVAQGDGWRQLLESLGVDQVVPGGQTMNPSAAELVAAIEAVDARHVVVLPNNSNIVFTARQ